MNYLLKVTVLPKCLQKLVYNEILDPLNKYCVLYIPWRAWFSPAVYGFQLSNTGALHGSIEKSDKAINYHPTKCVFRG